jgi:hypothetical protein
MDPLDIFYDIHELIIQHFNYDEIFKFSKVSTHWHNLILEKNKFAMEKIRLHVEDCNHDEVLKVLENKESKINLKLFELLKTQRKYQNIKINIDHGWDYIDQLVRNLSNFLVDIEVSSDIYIEDLKIPQLKFLKLNDALLDGLTTCSNKLKKFSVTQTGKEFWLKKESPQAVKRALMRNEELEILELDETLTEEIFSENFNEFSFNLKELSVKCENSLEIFGNLRSFLSRQESSLNFLNIKNCDVFTAQWIFENLTALKSFQLKIHFEENPRDFNLSVNPKIIALDLDITAFWQWTMNIKFALRKFISSAPNLEILILRMPSPLDLDDFRFILTNAKKLRKLKQNVDEYLNIYCQVHEQMCYDHEGVNANIKFSNLFH